MHVGHGHVVVSSHGIPGLPLSSGTSLSIGWDRGIGRLRGVGRLNLKGVAIVDLHAHL